jgi:hypothetical protein
MCTHTNYCIQATSFLSARLGNLLVGPLKNITLPSPCEIQSNDNEKYNSLSQRTDFHEWYKIKTRSRLLDNQLISQQYSWEWMVSIANSIQNRRTIDTIHPAVMWQAAVCVWNLFSVQKSWRDGVGEVEHDLLPTVCCCLSVITIGRTIPPNAMLCWGGGGGGVYME